MHIFDKENNRITITDLPEAIRMAADFKDLHHLDPAFAQTDKMLQVYWCDMHHKLLQLQHHLQHPPTRWQQPLVTPPFSLQLLITISAETG